MSIKLSILDQCIVLPGQTPVDAVAQSLELARLGDALGYHRYWGAEHHDSPGFCSPVPEIMITRVGAETNTIRIGSGGVLLAHYSPLKVAETFRMLMAMYPGRVDLGLGRAPGALPWTTQALRTTQPKDADAQYVERTDHLLRFLRNDFPDGHPLHGIAAQPLVEEMPQVWMLGSSHVSAMIAAQLGCAYSSAHFINTEGAADVMQAYARAFTPSPHLESAAGNVAVFVICHEDEDYADRLAKTRDLWRLRLSHGDLGPVPSIEEAEAREKEYAKAEKDFIRENRKRMVAGTPKQCKKRLEEIAEEFGVPEVIVLTNLPNHEDRLNSYQLLAEEFKL